MSTDTSRNNFTLGFALSGVVALLCLFLPWASFVAQGGTGMGSMMNGATLTITGTNGSFNVMGLPMPTWFIVVLSVVGAIMLLLRMRGLIALPAAVVFAPIAVSLLFSVIGFFLLMAQGSPLIGILAINAASITTLVLGLRSPAPH